MNHKNFTPFTLGGLVLLASLLGGCATQPKTLYNWGNYQNQLYARFNSNAAPEKQIQEMEKTLQAPTSDKPIPPGFHAHLGLLYGEIGRQVEMCEQFNIEKQLFPESSQFMDFLLTKVDPTSDKKDIQ